MMWHRHYPYLWGLELRVGKLSQSLKSQSQRCAELSFNLRVPSLSFTFKPASEKRPWHVASRQGFFLFLRSRTLWSQCPLKRVHGRSSSWVSRPGKSEPCLQRASWVYHMATVKLRKPSSPTRVQVPWGETQVCLKLLRVYLLESKSIR